MTPTAQPRATVEDLYRVPENGKAELVNGELVLMPPTGSLPNRASGFIYRSLSEHEEAHPEQGSAFTDNIGFLVKMPHRESFSPDAAWYVGDIESMKFLPGAPVFAVEVRSENDYGPRAERDIAFKIADYFRAGTLVVWDVDLQAEEEVILKYTADIPNRPVAFRRGQVADAEPAVPGWRFEVDRLFGTRPR